MNLNSKVKINYFQNILTKCEITKIKRIKNYL